MVKCTTSEKWKEWLAISCEQSGRNAQRCMRQLLTARMIKVMIYFVYLCEAERYVKRRYAQ